MIASMTVYKVLRSIEGSYYSATYAILPAAYRVEYVAGQPTTAPAGTYLFAFETLEAAASFQSNLEAQHEEGVYSIHVALAVEVEKLGNNKVMNKMVNLHLSHARGVTSDVLARFWAQEALFGLIRVPFEGAVLCGQITIQA